MSLSQETSQAAQQGVEANPATLLKAVLAASPAASTIMKMFKKRRRFRRSTNINQLEAELVRQGHNITHDDVIAAFAALSATGAGSLVKGQNDASDRFEWNYSLKDVAKAAFKGVSLDLLPKLPPMLNPPTPKVDAKGRKIRADGKLDKRTLNPGRPAKARRGRKSKYNSRGQLLTKSGKVDGRQFNVGRPEKKKRRAAKTSVPKAPKGMVMIPVPADKADAFRKLVS